MKAEEFNKLMAVLKYPQAMGYLEDSKAREAWLKGHIAVNDYYNDLNLLMPLAWKYGIYVTEMCGEFTGHYYPVNVKKRYTSKDKDPIQAIRDCLTAIAKDK